VFPPGAAEWHRLRLPEFVSINVSELYIENRKQGKFFLYIYMAHVRRKFFDLVEAHRSSFAITAWSLSGNCTRSKRRSRSRRAACGSTKAITAHYWILCTWLQEGLTKPSRKSDTTAAVRYALGLWEALVRYCVADRLQGRRIRGPRNPVHVCAVLTHPHMHATCSL
jgi:Transposase IS66 family